MLVNDSLLCFEYPDDKFDILVQVSPEVKAPFESKVEDLIVTGEVIPDQAPVKEAVSQLLTTCTQEKASVMPEKARILEKEVPIKSKIEDTPHIIPKKAPVRPKIR